MPTSLSELDRRLLAVPPWVKWSVIALTLGVIAVHAARYAPFGEPRGTDTIADDYEARVIRNDVRDMYTKRLVDQTPLEAATYDKEASSPYPPATLLSLTGLSIAGDATGIRLTGMVTVVAVVFLLLSLGYFLWRRWYLFPLLYLNFSYLGERFFYVQDGSYLVMLLIVVAALYSATRRPTNAALLMAVAGTMKLSPLYYARHVLFGKSKRWIAVAWFAVVTAGLVLPYFIWENYLYIFRFHNELKGGLPAALGGGLVASAFAIALWKLDRHGVFDREEQIGWALVPIASFLAFQMNTTRHLLLPLLIPDKGGTRNIAAAAGLALDTIGGAAVSLNDTLPVMTVILALGLWRSWKSSRRSRQ